jgi:hypothetical protein
MDWMLDLKFSLGISVKLKRELKFLINEKCPGIPIKDFINVSKSYINWGLVYEEYYLVFSEEFIELFEHQYDDLAWLSISYNQRMSEKYILRNINNLHTLGISLSQKISEEFIENNMYIFRTANHWALLFRNMKSRLSTKFREKYKYKLKH